MWPLSQGEIQGTKEFFIDALFSEKLTLPTHSRLTREELIQKIIFGGYPEVLTRQSEDRRYAWFDSYITTILQRDVRDIANIDGLMQLPRLLTLLATRASRLFNLAEISRISGIAQTTLSRYFAVLQTIFLIYTIPAYSNNLGKRLTKSSKLYFCDTGLSTHLLGITFSRLQHEPDLLGPLLENFVANELKKQLSWNKTHAELFHYRTTNGQEVDFILENKAGFAIGIEVKSSATLSEKDFKGLKHLSETLDDKLIRGILLYTGQQTLSFGKNLYAIPIGLLWEKN
ncbi:hypothetical protein AYO45_06365 [Gammaproteobacteria bacterium SCGC AG-212-F23]|nr:hypothetical protein AYO45_06365 [Gammaproteobacteria bacterium SCGC AG-212-F23]